MKQVLLLKLSYFSQNFEYFRWPSRTFAEYIHFYSNHQIAWYYEHVDKFGKFLGLYAEKGPVAIMEDLNTNTHVL